MRRTVQMTVSENFFIKMDRERKRLQNESGIEKISQPKMTELMSRNFPRIKLTNIQLKDAKRKKRFSC